MVSIILVLCLALAPTECREVRAPFDASMVECLMAAEAIAADFLQEHPGLVLRGWRCRGNREGVPA